MKRLFHIFILVSLVWSSGFALTSKELARSINLAGKQRMLLQRMSKDAFLLHLGVEPQKIKKDLQWSMELFARTLQGLQKGDEELGLVPIEDQKIQNALQQLQQEWEPFQKSLKVILLGQGDSKGALDYIYAHNLKLLRDMNAIVEMYVAHNKGQKIKRAQAINLAGKERMLSQKIAKDVALIQLGYEDAKKDLEQDKALFAKILRGLQNGDTSLGLEATKLPWIKRELKRATKLWDEYAALAQPKLLSKAELAQLNDKSLKLLAQMNKITGLYEKSINKERRARALAFLVQGYMQKKQQAKHIINLAGKQRMLTQRMTKLALLDAMGKDKEKSEKLLDASYKLYDKTLHGFLHGDKELGLPPAKSERIKKMIAYVEQEWEPFKQNVQKVLASHGKDVEALAYLIKHNEELLKRSNDLVQLFKKEYKTNNFLEDARQHIVDIAGRQRMLTQKMTKEKLLVRLGIEPNINRAKMEKTVALFDDSLRLLMYGDKSRYVIKPTNPKLIAQYKKVDTLWQELKPLYLKKNNSAQEMETIIHKNPILLKEMDRAVKLTETVLEY